MVRLMHELAAREITSVLIEGGGTTLASAFEAGVVDKVLFFIARRSSAATMRSRRSRARGSRG